MLRLPDRQRNELSPRRANGADDIAIEIVDLHILDAVQDEYVDMPVRTCAYVRGVGPCLAQSCGRRFRGSDHSGQAEAQEHAERGTSHFVHGVSPCWMDDGFWWNAI